MDVNLKNKLLKFNVIWFTVLIFLTLGIFYGISFVIIGLFWVIDYIITMNNTYILSSNSTYSYIIKKNIYLLSLIIPLFFNYKIYFITSMYSFVMWTIICTVCSILLLIPKIRLYRIYLSNFMISRTQETEKIDIAINIFTLLFTPFFEEYFYRNFIISMSMASLGGYSILLSAYLFIIHHFKVRWSSQYTKYDYLIQLIFGICSGAVYYFSHSIVPCIVGHYIYNMPILILEIKKLKYIFKNYKNILIK